MSTFPAITYFTQYNTNNNGDYLGAGEGLVLEYAPNEPLTVAPGTVLNLSNGAEAIWENAGAGINFIYSAAAGDATMSDLQVIGYTGAITDSAGNSATPPTLAITNVSLPNSADQQTITGTAAAAGLASVVGQTVTLKS